MDEHQDKHAEDGGHASESGHRNTLPRTRTRVGKVLIGAFFDPEVRDEVKLVALEDKITLQELMERAVDMLLADARARGVLVPRKAKPRAARRRSA